MAALPELTVPLLPPNIDELAVFEFTATATDADPRPPDTLTFSLDTGTPLGATITTVGNTGVFTWTPSEAQGPGDYQFDVVVTDSTANEDRQTINVTVNEVNVAPVLGAIGNQSGDELVELTFTALATDADVPADTLTYSLAAGFPSGASIDPVSGVFSWTPAEDQGNATITVQVTDNVPNSDVDASETITITVK